MAAIHSHLEVRAIGTVLRSMHVTTGQILRFDPEREWPVADDWFDGWDKTLSTDFTTAGSEDRPVVLWDPVNASELAAALGPLIDGLSPLILVANLGFPFGDLGARRYEQGAPASDIGLHPFSGAPLAHGIYPDLDWDHTSEPGLSTGLADVLAAHNVPPAPDGRLSDHRKMKRCVWDLSATLGCAVIVTRSWMREAGLHRTTFGAIEAATHKAILAELWPMTRRLALRNQGLEERTDRLAALAERMHNLRDRTRLAESLLAERNQWAQSPSASATSTPAAEGKPKLSIVHISYDMEREAPRSIRTALPIYQTGVDAGAVEVIAIDNGSPAPLVLDDELSRNPMVRLHRMDPATTTLAAAINTGVDLASADRVAVMIDGAHLLSPGIVSWTLRSFDLIADPIVAAPRYFLGPSQQVDAHLHDYDTEAEDRLLGERGWPENGYALFEASVLIGDAGQTWASALFETNYLAMTKAAFAEIGGADTRFSDPAGGFLNMDLFSRAVERMHGEYVLLAGEGTFHQLHGGTTTNTSRKNRTAKVERYREEFERLHGRPYVPTPRRPLVVGHLHAGVIESRSFSESFQHEANLQRADLLADHLKRASSGDAS